MQLDVKFSKLSELSHEPQLKHPESLKLETKPLGEGGFGKIYICKSINGKKLRQPLAVKISNQDNQHSAINYETIQKLQNKINAHNNLLKSQK